MKRLAAPIALVFLAAACGKDPAKKVGSNEPQAAAQAKPAESAAPVETPTASASAAPVATETKDAGADESRKKTLVVHIGDSFTHAHFQQNLGPRIHALGARYQVLAKTPSYTTTWSSDPELDRLLYSKPALVLITLGANEMDMKQPEDHAGGVRAIAKKVAKWSPSCVWVSPPSWKKERAPFLDVIKNNCAPCIYFDSDALAPKLERTSDGIHPNKEGGAKWATAFWEWMEARREPARGAWVLRPE